jgi:surface carbohydrate biosynthesis protein
LTLKLNRWVYVLVEVTKRELDSRALIATKLAQKGLNVVLGEKNEILWGCCLGVYPPGVIFDKCAQILDDKKWQKLKRKGFVFTSLDEEGLVTQPDYFFAQRFSEKAAKESALTFCWGRKQADMIRTKYPEAKLVESGNPRMSLLHKNSKHWFDEEISEIKKKYGKFVLVCSSFNPFEDSYDESNNWRRKEDEKAKKSVLGICDQLVGVGIKVIYRPHPSDAPVKVENMEVDGRWSIVPWLHSCSLLINANCATSFDAYVSGTPCLSPRSSSREYSFRLANAFARKIKNDKTDGLVNCKPIKSKMHDRIAHHHVSFLEDQDEPTSIIAKKLEELSFSTSMKPKECFLNIISFIEFKNIIRFKIKGYDYRRISNKFEYKHLRSCTNKINGLTKRIMTKKVVYLSL